MEFPSRLRGLFLPPFSESGPAKSSVLPPKTWRFAAKKFVRYKAARFAQNTKTSD
jgi:hypothetical protein